jgi:hypothetical protein
MVQKREDRSDGRSRAWISIRGGPAGPGKLGNKSRQLEACSSSSKLVKMEAWSLQSVGHISAGARPSIGSSIGLGTGSISCMPARTAPTPPTSVVSSSIVLFLLQLLPPRRTPFLPIHSLLLALQFSSPLLSLLLMINADNCMHAYPSLMHRGVFHILPN